MLKRIIDPTCTLWSLFSKESLNEVSLELPVHLALEPLFDFDDCAGAPVTEIEELNRLFVGIMDNHRTAWNYMSRSNTFPVEAPIEFLEDNTISAEYIYMEMETGNCEPCDELMLRANKKLIPILEEVWRQIENENQQ